MKENYFTFKNEEFRLRFNCTTKEPSGKQVCKARWLVYVSRKKIKLVWRETPNHPEGSESAQRRMTKSDKGK